MIEKIIAPLPPPPPPSKPIVLLEQAVALY